MSGSRFKSIFRRLEVQRGSCYAKGWDAAVNGPNEDNCHFSIFSTPENTREWEAGNDAGKAFEAKST